jgi:hypothetical protein
MKLERRIIQRKYLNLKDEKNTYSSVDIRAVLS